MRKTEVYQIRLDSQEKKLAFAVFKQLGITPAQAVRLFFKQVVLTKSIPFAIENQNIDMDQLFKLRQKNRVQATPHENNEQPTNGLAFDQEHDDLFDELNALLGESEKH
ncbi:type II toxin-antitoxin system RelB/DinJ family antitoxin [Acinetobacter sp.]|uniref:type II toxin-antitoxin system RelB/DinJ family antitoxin n=1 Tax=Acinetobacter sp. TaxID=472 RepID=UPI0031E0010B